MQLSIIILNYNVRYFIEICVLSVQKAIKNLDAEIIVVDNNSTDDSCEMMKQRFPNVRLIENKENLGFPKGNNIGVNVAKGEYICILNPDTIVAENTFEKILKSDILTQKFGAIGCKLIDGTGNFLPESKRGIPTPWVAFTKIFSLYKIFPKNKLFNQYYAQHLDENQTGKVNILVGAFMFMKRELYMEIGGFDEKCFMYSDDIDLSYMILQKNLSNYYFHETTVIHYKGESTIKDGTYMKRFQEAMAFFYKKHFKISLFFSVFMKIGIVLFSVFKMFQGKTKIKLQPKSYYFVSDNEHTCARIALKLEQKVEKISDENYIFPKNSEIIFDNNFMNFTQIISFFNKNASNSFTFKILPQNSNFIIGSNSSNEPGAVIVF